MEILNSYPVMGVKSNPLIILFIILLAISVACSLAFFFAEEFYVGLLFMFLAVVLIAPITNYAKKIPTEITEYQVILDEDYSAQKLYDEYVVIRREGKIWIIQDKENNKNEGENTETEQ